MSDPSGPNRAQLKSRRSFMFTLRMHAVQYSGILSEDEREGELHALGRERGGSCFISDEREGVLHALGRESGGSCSRNQPFCFRMQATYL